MRLDFCSKIKNTLRTHVQAPNIEILQLFIIDCTRIENFLTNMAKNLKTLLREFRLRVLIQENCVCFLT